MLTPAYKLTLGSGSQQSGKASDLLDLETRAALGIPVNICRVVLNGEASIDLNPEDAVSIQLGYGEALPKVFTGKVTTVGRGIEQTSVNSASAFNALATTRCNCLYEKQNAGDIAGDLLGRLNIGKARLAAGEKFASFSVSGQHLVWDVLSELALRCGFDFYADTSDRAVFQAYAPHKIHSVEYGLHLLDYLQETFAHQLDGVEVYGESPVGQGEGEKANTWLTKKEVKGSAGKTNGNILRLTDAVARSPDQVRVFAANILQAKQSQLRGRLRVLGNPDIQLGDAVAVSKMPRSSQNGTYKVTSVRHRLNARVGFVTEVGWERVK